MKFLIREPAWVAEQYIDAAPGSPVVVEIDDADLKSGRIAPSRKWQVWAGSSPFPVRVHDKVIKVRGR